jgi:hypothetical protein
MQTKTAKLTALLAFHRRNVFNERNGDAHGRALMRLKRTRTYLDMCQANRDAAIYRQSQKLLSMYA